MSSTLHTLGRWCATHAGRVLALWTTLIIALAAAVSATGIQLNNSFTIAEAESLIGLDVLHERLPEAAGTAEQALFTVPDDITAHRDAVETFVSEASQLPGITRVSNPFDSLTYTVSDDHHHVFIQIQGDSSLGSMATGATPQGLSTASALKDLAHRAESTVPGLTVELGGNIGKAVNIALSVTELIGIAIAAAVLFATFGSLLAAGAPIVSALIGVGSGMLAMLLAAAAIDINSTTPVLAVMIGLAVGIDYALFIIARAREYLREGLDPAEAAGRATATAGSAVVFAGGTVIVALCGLSVAGIPFLTVMGCASAAVVALSVVVALTAVPALLGLIGVRTLPRSERRLSHIDEADTPTEGSTTAANASLLPNVREAQPASPRERTHATPEQHSSARDADHRADTSSPTDASTPASSAHKPKRGRWAHAWVRLITRMPALTSLIVIAILAVATLPVTGMSLGLTDNGYEPKGTMNRTTYDSISAAYGDGYNSPIIVIADIVQSTDPLGTVSDLSSRIRSLHGVKKIALATPNRDASLAFIQVIPDHGQTSPETAALVREIRSHADQWEGELGITQLMVTGQTAVAIDIASQLNRALLPFGSVVVGLSILLLMIVFRSVAVPLTATLGYVLSLGAGFGAVGAVFGWGWGAELLHVTKTGVVISFLPVIVMGVLFGLAMDYQVFLVSRMREEWIHHRDAAAAVREGFVGSSQVVVAAALIMTAVFAAFIPEGNLYIKPIAVALTVGIAADAFLVRLTLIPALMAFLGEKAWWIPRWADRLLPVVDVEGEGLARTLEHADWVGRHGEAVLRWDRVTVRDEASLPLISPLTIALAPGELGVLRSDDALVRRALAEVARGHLLASEGIVAICGTVMPEGGGHAHSHTVTMKRADEEIPPYVRLVVVPTPGAARWERIRLLLEEGRAVLVLVPTQTEIPSSVTPFFDRRVASSTRLTSTADSSLTRAPQEVLR